MDVCDRGNFMKDRIISIIKCFILLAIVAALFVTAKNGNIEQGITNSSSKLVIFGDNIDKKYSPFVEDGKVYISLDTIESFIDEDIFYDVHKQKIIITNEEAVYKFIINDNKPTKNLVEYTTETTAKVVNNEPYIEMSLIKDIYNIKSEYDEETNTISIDKKDFSDLHLNYNDVKVYSALNTNSQILETLNKNNTVIVYVDSLKHNRWYKIKSDSGKVGYIEKSAVTLRTDEENEVGNNETVTQEKLIMFWQYGSNTDTLGDKIEGVNVVMPTWFAVSDSQGAVEINYDRAYYQKAKSNGYELWPIITNGLDNLEIDKKAVTSEIMNNEESRENLIRNIAGLIEEYKLDGINIDFEGMKEEDKYLYTQFLRELYPIVKSKGAKLSVDIYFTNYIDRKGVGKACDYVMLMGYDQRGNWSDEAGSIAEVSWVDKNINSLIQDSQIEPSKIILGVPFYTRLWNIKSDGTITTNVYSMKNSADFVSKYGLTPTLDEIAGQNYVEMTSGNTTYKLWIEDATSISNRADIVTKYNLAGITAWQKGFETEDIWQVLKEKLK